jgi:hypothetical protein
MSNTPRGWLQLHLSTCVVLMFVAGGLIGANSHGKIDRWSDAYSSVITREWGWPCSYRLEREFNNRNPYLAWDYQSICWNILAGLAILAAVALACEWWIRRRAATAVNS